MAASVKTLVREGDFVILLMGGKNVALTHAHRQEKIGLTVASETYQICNPEKGHCVTCDQEGRHMVAPPKLIQLYNLFCVKYTGKNQDALDWHAEQLRKRNTNPVPMPSYPRQTEKHSYSWRRMKEAEEKRRLADKQAEEGQKLLREQLKKYITKGWDTNK